MKKRKGVTLVELILVILVMSVTMAALTPYIRAIYRTWEYGDRRSEMLQNGRVSMDKAVKMLRTVRAVTDVDPSGQGGYIGFIDQNGFSVLFFHNVSGSPYYVGTAGYARDNDFIMRVTDLSNVTTDNPLARSLASLNFIYLKETIDFQDPAIAPEDVRAVKIDMSLSDPEGLLSGTLAVSSLAYCRMSDIFGGTVAVWVADWAHSQIVKLDFSGNELERIGGFVKPGAVSINLSDGSCWVADTGDVLSGIMGTRVFKFDVDGNEVAKVGGFNYPMAISVNYNDGSCWIADWKWHGQENHVVKVDSSGNKIVTARGFSWPYSVSVNQSDSSCWVADYAHDQVVKLSSGGTELIRRSGYRLPIWVSADSRDGSAWVITNPSASTSEVVKLNSSGNELVRVGGFNSATEISVDSTDGSCWVADTRNNQVVKLSSSGEELLRVGGFDHPWGVSVNPQDGTCWVTSYFGNEVVKLNSDGTELLRVSGFLAPTGIEVYYGD